MNDRRRADGRGRQEREDHINVGLVDLGQIDLLVAEGFYANRTDFIRTAIRRQLESRAAAVNDTVARRTLTLGTQHLSRRDLEGLRDAGQTIELRVLGLATVADDVTPSSRWRRSPRSRSSAPSGRRGRSRLPSPPAPPPELQSPYGADRPVDADVTPPKGLPWTPHRRRRRGTRRVLGGARRRARVVRGQPGRVLHRPDGPDASAEMVRFFLA